MTQTMTPREKVVFKQPCENCQRMTTVDLNAVASGSGDHAELARLAEWRDRLRADPGRAAHFGSPYADKPMHNGRTYWNSDLAEDIATLIAEVAALRGERDQIAGESIWWAGVIGDGSHQPSGEVRSIKHLHPAMVKPIYEANKGTAVADVIAGLIFSLAITENREQFLVADANERRTEAERKLAEARGLLGLFDAHLGEDDGMWTDDSTVTSEWLRPDGIRQSLTFGLFRRVRAFLSSTEAERG